MTYFLVSINIANTVAETIQMKVLSPTYIEPQKTLGRGKSSSIAIRLLVTKHDSSIKSNANYDPHTSQTSDYIKGQLKLWSGLLYIHTWGCRPSEWRTRALRM